MSNKMREVIASVFTGMVIGILGAVVLIGLAVLSGTILYFLWPIGISAFPGLVASGVIAAKLSWAQAVCLTWIMAILFKPAPSNEGKK